MGYEMSFVKSLRLLSIVSILLSMETATATAPSKISYQGRLMDSNADPVADDNGYATVVLPDWFGALNRYFRYQLTVIGGFAQAVVVDEILDNRFVIMTDKPHTRASWQVTGIRQDPFANTNRIQIEVDKRSEERGLFVHPDAFRKPAEQGIDFNSHQPPQLASPVTGGVPK